LALPVNNSHQKYQLLPNFWFLLTGSSMGLGHAFWVDEVLQNTNLI
jgi:hypothetical protein